MLPRETGKVSTLKERFPTGKTVMETVRSMAEVEAAAAEVAEEEHKVVDVHPEQVVSQDNRNHFSSEFSKWTQSCRPRE